MKRTLPAVALAVIIGFVAGRLTNSHARPVISGHLDDFSIVQAALAQTGEGQQQPPQQAPAQLPFGYDRPGLPALAPDAPPATYFNIDDIKKAHTDMAERAAKALAQTASGSTQAIGGGPVRLRTRNFSMGMLYRMHREQPVLSLTKVNSVWDDAEQHSGVYDFYIFTGGTGEMIVGGKIANRQNLVDKDWGPVPGEYRGQPIVGGQTFKVKAGDWLVIPPDAPHQPKPDPGGFSYMIMKINVGMYPWNLVR
jgi:mannose-6-phosphate isomerase-like protein (cupin superfamily)